MDENIPYLGSRYEARVGGQQVAGGECGGLDAEGRED